MSHITSSTNNKSSDNAHDVCDSVMETVERKNDYSKLLSICKKYVELNEKAREIRNGSAKRRQITEERRSKKLIKQALKDPAVKELVEKIQNPSMCSSQQSEDLKWEEVKPFLSTRYPHLEAVRHGDCKTKTELEHLIEDSVKAGDIEKAEQLSDRLANREFAARITYAFAAKRQYDSLELKKQAQRHKQMKNIRWTFETKERWQMKGNM